MAQEPYDELVEAPGTPDLRLTGEHIDALIEQIAGGGPANPLRARERAEELVRVVTDLYGAGLERLLELVHESGHLDEALLEALADDDLVASLLLVHGLHPYDVRTRVEQALDHVRPYLGSHGGDVELLGVEEGTVQLRLLGSCDGCPSSSVTLELAVQEAIEAAAPEVLAIEVEAPRETGGVIPVDALRARLDVPAPEVGGGAAWHTLPHTDLASGQATTTDVQGVTLLVCRVGTDLFAFRDSCGRCGSSLDGAAPARRLGGAAGDALLTCPACGAHFDVRRAGACVDAPELHLDPLPLLADGAGFSVALPAVAR
jgi:Fe-S cluster biogenesis protein NfuA/nitrite reductase/ring-hydroxylating ferredoxin subunit